MKNKILESLEDIVGQMQMNKVDNKTVLVLAESNKNIFLLLIIAVTACYLEN